MVPKRAGWKVERQVDMPTMLEHAAGGATSPWQDTECMQRRLAATEWVGYAERLEQDGAATWLDLATRYLTWETTPRTAMSGSFVDGQVRWFTDGMLDPTVSCLDRHLGARGDDTALIAVGDDPEAVVRWSFRDLHAQVCRAANALAALGVGADDAVGICLPTIPEAAVAMLACARLGAVHGVVFAGFGSEALGERWRDLGCRVVITADVIRRGGRCLALKATVDAALAQCPAVRTVLVVCRGDDVPWMAERDHRWDIALANASPERPPHPRAGDTPLFVLHTSGSTGRPKGLVHGTAGFLLHAALTHQATTSYEDSDRYACFADLGWITGHSYVLYGPLVNGAPVVLDEGTPLHPGPERYGSLVERLRLTVLFTVPTALRLIAAADARALQGTDLSTLRTITCAGEILDPAIHTWITRHLPHVRLVNIYGQTEGAGHLLAGNTGIATTPGVALRPCLGISAALIDEQGLISTGSRGRLVLTRPWPGLALTVFGDHARFVQSYFAAVPGTYVTGDRATRDDTGAYTVVGRDDDVVNVAGHRLAPAELETIARSVPGVVDAIAAGVPDELRGQALVVFVVAILRSDAAIIEAVRAKIRQNLGPFATPRAIVPVRVLPRTRSGKPLRRLLTAVVTGSDPGDLSTLADPKALDALREAWADHAMRR